MIGVVRPGITWIHLDPAVEEQFQSASFGLSPTKTKDALCIPTNRLKVSGN